MQQQLNIGLFGFGCVGQGLYHVSRQSAGWKAMLKKICIRDEGKERVLPASFFTSNAHELLDDPGIDVIVELTNDPLAAYEITTCALAKGKAVISANKKMIAENLLSLYRLQQEYKRPLLYEGACCASIPIIRNLEEYYDNDLLYSVEGIFNGSTNYVLTKIFDKGISFDQALKEAQEKGFAETDPRLDIEGIDSRLKLCIIILHAFGKFVEPDYILHSGIQNLNSFDIDFARQKGCKIKLVAKCMKKEDKVSGWCLPAFVPEGHKLARVDNEYNGILVESAFSESQYFEGKGAGGNPTGSAVLSDLSALSHEYKYEYKKYRQNGHLQFSTDEVLGIYLRYNNKTRVPLKDFISVSGKFEANENRYITGKMHLETVAKYISLEGVNVILLPENL